MFICMVCTTVITAVAVKLRYEEGEAVHIYTGWVKIAATALFTVLGFPLAVRSLLAFVPFRFICSSAVLCMLSRCSVFSHLVGELT